MKMVDVVVVNKVKCKVKGFVCGFYKWSLDGGNLMSKTDPLILILECDH